jgi:membrane protease YdiL (CAAX protease family)
MIESREREGMSYFSQFALLLGLFAAGLLIGSFLIAAVLQWATGMPMSRMETALQHSDNIFWARMAQSLGSFFMFALPALLFAGFITKQPAYYLRLNKGFRFEQFFYVLLLLICSFFIVGLLAEWNQNIPLPSQWVQIFQQMENTYNQQVIVLATMHSVQDFIFSLVVLALFPAMFEEMFFRGALQPVLIGFSKKVGLGIILTAFIFSIIHGSFYGLLPRFYLGIVLGYVYYYGRTLWLNIIFHFLNNAFALMQLYILSKQKTLQANDVANSNVPLWLGLAAVIIFPFLLVQFKKASEKLY